MNTLSKNDNIVILTGAGISAESGLATFRGEDGLWEGHRVEDVATPEAFERNPDLVHNFYNMRRRGLLSPEVQPNDAHRALAKLEKEWPAEVLIVTQNIDDLHERAGTENLIHMHGEVLKAFCLHCSNKARHTDDLFTKSVCIACGKEGGMRPDIVWFGEMPYQMDDILDAVTESGLFVSIGTSGNVYPAAGFVAQAKQYNAVCIELNLDPSANSPVFDESRQGPASEIVPQFVDELLALLGS